MRVPQQAGGGYAKLTLTLDGLKPGETVPATIEALILGDETDLPAARSAAKDAVPTLVKALQSERLGPENAAEALGLLGPAAKDAVPALTQALGVSNGSIRREAARALIRISPAVDIVPVFVQLLEHENPEYAQTAVNALTLLGPKATAAIPTLIQTLDREPSNINFWGLHRDAVEALGEIGTASDAVVSALTKALKHKYGAVRRNAARALGVMGSAAKSSVPALIQVVNNEDWDAILAAAEALGRMGPAAKDAIPALVRFKNKERPGYGRKESESAAEAVRLIESPESRLK